MTLLLKNKVLQEIELIPENKLADVYNFIHYFRLGLEKSSTEQQKNILAYAGCWEDMPDDMFIDFTNEITQRRRHAFVGRRNNEGSTG